MILSQVNPASASLFIKEHVKVLIHSLYSTAALAMGQAVCFKVSDSTYFGIGVTRPATANLYLPAGIVETAIASHAYGLARAFGFTNAALVDGTTSLGAGDPLKMTNGSFALALVTAGAEVVRGGVGFNFVAGEAYVTGAAAAKKVLIRCM